MTPTSFIQKKIPFSLVGSNVFGRYPKISDEQTFNMFVSDNWLVPFAGFRLSASIAPSGEGRGIYESPRLMKMVVVIDNGVYVAEPSPTPQVPSSLSVQKIGDIDTFSGDVFIDENNNSQIAICDKKDLWIFDYSAQTFSKANLNFTPAYIAFQDGYFIAPVTGEAEWRLSDPNDGTSWPDDANHTGTFQTKPNNCVGAVRVPGKGNLLFLFGNTVTEPWYDTGAQLFPYQRNSYFNIDYGCINQATIATNGTYVAWIAINEKSGPVIMVSEGGPPEQISNDGINYKLAHLTNPSNSYAFMVKQDGHMFYIFSFPDDGLTYAWDFNEKRFYTLTDELMGTYQPRRVAFFNNTYYFISAQNGNLFELNSLYTDYDGQEIPRVRVTKNYRLPDGSRFVANIMSWTMEQGQNPPTTQRVDMSLCRDGGESFSSYVPYLLNNPGVRKSKPQYFNLGSANDLVFQMRFWGFNRFVVTDGLIGISQ